MVIKFKFRLDPTDTSDEMNITAFQIAPNFGVQKIAVAYLLFNRLVNKDDYQVVAAMSNEEQQEVLVQLFESINESKVWMNFSRN